MHDLDILRKHLALKVDVSATDFDKFVALTKKASLKKGEFFLREGKIAKHQIFLLSGVTTTYSIDSKGEKHVVQIAIQGHWTSDLFSFLTEAPSSFYIEAMEDTQLLLLSKKHFELACNQIPIFERFFRLLIQNGFINLQRRISNIYSESAEERYLKLLTEKPEMVQSVPQHYLASFLGIKAQSLSRIRKSITDNAK